MRLLEPWAALSKSVTAFAFTQLNTEEAVYFGATVSLRTTAPSLSALASFSSAVEAASLLLTKAVSFVISLCVTMSLPDTAASSSAAQPRRKDTEPIASVSASAAQPRRTSRLRFGLHSM